MCQLDSGALMAAANKIVELWWPLPSTAQLWLPPQQVAVRP